MNQFSIEIINTGTDRKLHTIHALTLDELQERYSAWKEWAKDEYRLSGFHAVIKKFAAIDMKWEVVATRVQALS